MTESTDADGTATSLYMKKQFAIRFKCFRIKDFININVREKKIILRLSYMSIINNIFKIQNPKSVAQ